MIIYSYSTKTYREKSWWKIGKTEQGDDSMSPRERAQIRVNQQDTTSNPEPLEIDTVWEVPDHIDDEMVHAQLEKMGFYKVRSDKDREWIECSINDISTAINQLVTGVSRPNSYAPRAEQQDCINQAVAHYQNGGTKFLINAKMRFGKTFTGYEIVRDLKLSRILVLTYKPQVDDGWREDMEDHVNYSSWTYYSAKEYSAENPIVLPGVGTEVLFASFQDFNDFDKKKWSVARTYHYDMIIIDEEHYGSKTDRAQESLKQLTYDRKLCVSGTPLKALMSGEFTEDEIYTWGYADEQERKAQEAATNWATEVYRWLPTMEFHTFTVCNEAKQSLAAYSDDEGFTMTKMFSSDDGIKFNDEASVSAFLDQVFGVGAVRKTNSPLRTTPADHQLWAMPGVKAISAMEKLLNKRANNEYYIINASDDNVVKIKDVKQAIRLYEKTITLTCGRFNTGVTVPEWDLVMMLDDTKSPETYFQTIFRCQSPDEARLKDKCYVIDFNPQRCLELIYEFADITAKKGQSTQESVRKFLEFAPVLDHVNNKAVPVDVNQVLSMIANTGGYAERFGSSYMFNWGVLDHVADCFNGVDPEANVTVTNEVNDNGLVKGKNFEPTAVAKTKTKDQQKEERELRQRAITTMRRLPTYLYVEKSKIDNLNDIVTTNNEHLFFDSVGIGLTDLETLINSGFINVSRLNRAIMSFNQISSLPS